MRALVRVEDEARCRNALNNGQPRVERGRSGLVEIVEATERHEAVGQRGQGAGRRDLEDRLAAIRVTADGA